MQSNSSRDIMAYYPVLPPEFCSAADAASMQRDMALMAPLRDMRIVWVLPCCDIVCPASPSASGMDLRGTVLGASGGTLKVRLSCSAVSQGFHEDVSIAIYGSAADVDMSGSYAIASGPVSDFTVTEGSSYPINPSCIVPIQTAPSILHVSLHRKLNAAAVAYDRTQVPAGTGTLKFVNGHNSVCIAGTSGMTVYGASGMGNGLFTESPYVDSSGRELPLYPRETDGLQTVNGMHGDVEISATGGHTIVTSWSTSSSGTGCRLTLEKVNV